MSNLERLIFSAGGRSVRLSQISVSNHRRLADMTIQVREHLVLVGPNDVGKSSILRCLDLLLGASTAQLYSRVTADDFRDAEQPMVVEADLIDLTDVDQALFPDEIIVAVGSGQMHLSVRLIATLDAEQTLSIDRTAPGSGTGRQLSREQLAGIGWKLLGTTAASRDLRDERRTVVNEILSSIELGSEQAAFDKLTDEVQERLAKSTVLGNLRGELAGQLSKALPEAVAKDDLLFVSGAAAEEDALSDVRLQVTKDGTPTNLGEQSDGMRALYAIALYDLVSVGANMVAIDEPEVHLHPTSQRSLARLLRTGPNQKFLATHSPDIVGAFSPDCVVAVRAGGQVVQPVKGFLSDDERMSVRWWVRDRLEPLTALRVVAVEGISDRIILERICDLTGRSLDRLGVCVIETGGAGDMGPFYKLFGKAGFDVPMSMLIDTDATKATADKLGIAEADLTAHSVWVSSPDLEAEYVAALGAQTVWAAIEASSLFSKNERSTCNSSGAGGVRTDKDVAEFCRRKNTYKVRAAMIVAGQLTEPSARAVGSIENLLAEFSTA